MEEIYRSVMETMRNVDPLLVLGGLLSLAGMALGYNTITSYDSRQGITPPQGKDKKTGYDPNLAFRRQGFNWYGKLIGTLSMIMGGTTTLYEGLVKV